LPLVKEVKFFHNENVKGGTQLSNDDLKFIAERLTFEFFEAGEFVIHSGCKGDKFFIILKGKTCALIPDPNTLKKEIHTAGSSERSLVDEDMEEQDVSKLSILLKVKE
jgi:CRP-like cAMP-binding protein